jgi:hypothetical protein
VRLNFAQVQDKEEEESEASEEKGEARGDPTAGSPYNGTAGGN